MMYGLEWRHAETGEVRLCEVESGTIYELGPRDAMLDKAINLNEEAERNRWPSRYRAVPLPWADVIDEVDEDEDENGAPVAFYSVTVFLVDRAFGGNEEGGWYYDCGWPVREVPEGVAPADMIRTFAPADKVAAFNWRDELQAKLDAGINVGRRPISSVLSEGMYEARICAGAPAAFPATRPHYE